MSDFQLPINQIIQGDCLEVMRGWPDKCVDLIVTDPPYGVNLDTSYSKWETSKQYDKVYADDKPFDPRPLLRLSDRAIMWGGNCFADQLPRHFGWLAWVKTQRNGAKIRQAEMELAWTNFVTRSQAFRMTWIGAYREKNDNVTVHPTQKPIELMRWCISLFPDAQTILDPYCGSGTTCLAAKQLGKDFIGIEIEPKYVAICKERLKQEQLPL